MRLPPPPSSEGGKGFLLSLDGRKKKRLGRNRFHTNKEKFTKTQASAFQEPNQELPPIRIYYVKMHFEKKKK